MLGWRVGVEVGGAAQGVLPRSPHPLADGEIFHDNTFTVCPPYNI